MPLHTSFQSVSGWRRNPMIVIHLEIALAERLLFPNHRNPLILCWPLELYVME